MAGCDGWITIKILELLFASFCMIYKRVTDDEARKLFYFLQKFSREWPLLNNVTWEENGAIFADITYGGYIIIIIGLIIGQCSGELQRCRNLENFFLLLGALLFIAVGSLELASLESVEERLVDNAAILGVFSFLTGFLFIIDWLSASKRRKREKVKLIKKTTQTKLTQTEDKKPMEINRASDMNGNFQNGRPYSSGDKQNGVRLPSNAVKLLPSSPPLSDITLLPVKPSGIEEEGGIMYSMEPPIFDKSELKTYEGKIKSTESFLRSEKGLYPKVSKTLEQHQLNSNFFIPTGYVLVPTDHLQQKTKTKSDSGVGDSPTPPGYAQIIPDAKVKSGYVIIPIDPNESKKSGGKKLQSPTVTTTMRPQQEAFHGSGRRTRPQTPNFHHSASDVSDIEETRPVERYKFDGRSRKHQKFPPEYLEMASRNGKYMMHSEDSSDEPKLSYPSEISFSPDSRSKFSHDPSDWRYQSRGKINEGYAEDRDNFFPSVSRKSSPYRSRASSPEKPKSILRFDYGKPLKKENGLHFPKDIRYDSLDSHKISEDLKNLKEITNSDLNLNRNLEEENKLLKERLRREKEAKEKLKQDLDGKKRSKSSLDDSEEEKNRRMSEREEQYFGIKDLKQSHAGSGLETSSKMKQLEKYFSKEGEKIGKGAKEINESLKEKNLEHQIKAAKEAQEFRDLIDERFHFLHEEEKRKKSKDKRSLERSESPGKSVNSEVKSIPETADHSKNKKSDSDDTNYSQLTEEGIRLRVETPGSASYKSEALFWLGDERENESQTPTPTSPQSPGYVLYTAKNWPESPSPDSRFQFSAKEAQQLAIGTRSPKTPTSEIMKSDVSEERQNSQKSRLLDYQSEDIVDTTPKTGGLRKNLLIRKVDFPKEPVTEIKKPTVVAGSTSTWKKWLHSKPKLQQTKSMPN